MPARRSRPSSGERPSERVSLHRSGHGSRAALAVALAAGLRYTDPPGLLLSSEPAGPQALVPHGYSLF